MRASARSSETYEDWTASLKRSESSYAREGTKKLVLGRLTYRLDRAGSLKVPSMQIVAWVLLGLWALGTAVLFAVDGSKFGMLGLF